ncbi:MAG: Cytochrome c oxidase subunit 3 [bacterium]|nr:Cytochrome c oxidase subunit 3 [bacterium]
MSTVAATENYSDNVMPIGKMGIWWFLASEIMVFGGLIGSYILYRLASAGAWAEMAHHVSTTIGAINTVVLLTSSLTMVLAHAAVEDENRQRAKLYLGLTVLGGILFLIFKAVEYTTEISHGFTPLAGTFWSFYFTMTGLHGLHVIGGIIANLALFVMAARGTLWPNTQKRVEYCGLYWHFVDVVWIFLFPLLYLSY